MQDVFSEEVCPYAEVGRVGVEYSFDNLFFCERRAFVVKLLHPFDKYTRLAGPVVRRETGVPLAHNIYIIENFCSTMGDEKLAGKRCDDAAYLND